jgi:SH3 domain protein
MNMRRVILILLLLAFTAAPALAQTRYVSDELVVLLRQGQSEKYKILKMLKANTPLEVLQEEEEYLLVRTPDGTEGYVLKQYITTETPKPIIIARLEKEREKLRGQLKQLETRQAELQAELANASKDRSAGETQVTELRRELTKVQGEYSALQEKSAAVIEISADRDRLEAQNAELTAEVERLRQDNEEMLFTGVIKWFLAGGGVFLVGWIIGKVSRRKKKGYSY